MHQAEVPLGKTRFSRYSQTSLTALLLLLSFIAVGKLSTPSIATINLIGSWSKPAVVDIVNRNDASQCQQPNFLLFEYNFKGLAMGCACGTQIVHSGYCTKQEIQKKACRETSPIYPKTLTSYNASGVLCAQVANLVGCADINKNCTSGFCTEDEAHPCPLLDLQVAVFPPANDYYKIVDLNFNGQSLFASRLTGRSPVSKTTTIKGQSVCLDSSVESVGNFTNKIYNSVTLLQPECSVGMDPRWHSLSSIQDHIMYESNNLTIVSQGNSFNIFVKNIIPVTNESINASIALGKVGCKFQAVCILMSIGSVVLFTVQQVILHKYQSASPLIFVVYSAEMIIAAYSYTKVADYSTVTQKITLLDDTSKQQMRAFQQNLDVCSRILLAISVLAAIATTLKAIKLAIQARKACKKMKRQEDTEQK